MSIFYQRAFWLNLAGACVAAIVAAVPVMMSDVMQRGFTLAKQSVAEPLAVLALGAVLLGLGWKWMAQQGAAVKIAAGALMVFLVLAVVSTALSGHPEIAVFGNYSRREGLLAWSAYIAFFFAMLGWAHHAGRVEGLIDVLLLSSVAAAAYALQQRLDLDFYPLGMRDFTRPSSTLGNPLFLAAYLAILLPVTAARCWQARGSLSELAPWLVVAALQVCGILVTQSRGPLLAAIFGILLLVACCAGRAHARRAFLLQFVILAAVAASVAVINTLPVARHWAEGVPVVARLVFNLDRTAGEQTQRASRSAASRFALWGAGVETFSAAPLENKLLGYGPDSAADHFFPFIPASLMRLIGYGHNNMFERMHADTLEIGLNFGLLAWLVYCLFFGAVMYAAARALWGLSTTAAPWIFFLFMCAGGAVSCAVAVQAGLSSAAAPAFGLGIGGGWFVFMVVCAWRQLKHAIPVTSERQAGRWILLAGLTSALWIFWIDAQISIPVPATRLISFGIAALVLVIADGIVRGAATGAEFASDAWGNLRAWGIACALVAACASCLPVILPDAGAQDARWSRRVIPIFSLLLVAAFAQWGHAPRGGLRAWLVVAAGLPLIYAAGHLALMIVPESRPTAGHVSVISMLSYAGGIFIFALCLIFAWVAGKSGAMKTDPVPVSRMARWSIAAVASAVLLVAAVDWQVRRADVAAMLASRVSVKGTQAAEQLLAEAIRLQPHEREFRRQLVFELLERAVTDMRKLEAAGQQPADARERILGMMRNLAAAETAAREAVALFPRDPWVIVALANVLQIEALRVLRPLDPEGGARAAAEANQLFSRAHRLFPAEPLLLRNWAQLLADQGNLADAYHLFNLMEKIIPGDPEPYLARLVVARQSADNKSISDTLARARTALTAKDFDQLVNVVYSQQK